MDLARVLIMLSFVPVRIVPYVLLLMTAATHAAEGDIREWMKGQTIECGFMKITFASDGRDAKYLFTTPKPSGGRFKVKWRPNSATLSFDYESPQDGPFRLHWLRPGSGVLYLDTIKCSYL